MKASRIAARVPMKKLFAVALVGTASTTAIALHASSTRKPTQTHELCGLTNVDTVAPVAPVSQPIAMPEPDPDPQGELVIEPLALRTGSPACGNVTYKGSRGPRPCTTAERAVKVITRTALFGMRPDAF